MRRTLRLFQIFLLAYPKRIRQESGADIWLTFERHLRDARRTGRWRGCDLLGPERLHRIDSGCPSCREVASQHGN